MNPEIALERCQAFINCQLQPGHVPALSGDGQHLRAVTISRQTGSGGHTVAEQLAALLQAQEPAGGRPWTIFDRNLVERVLEDHHLPNRLARFMPEDRVLEISDTMDELFGLHPPSWILVRKTAETILRLAGLGNVIIIGRGASIITSKLAHVVHVRLVGSLARRAEYMARVNGCSLKEALKFVRREDLGRRRYLRKYFQKDIDDPLLFHLIINMDSVSAETAARMIAAALVPAKAVA